MKADKCLYSDNALHADILESLRRGCQVHYDEEDGILIRDSKCGVYMLSAEPEAGKRLIDRLSDCDCIVLRGSELHAYARKKLHLTGENPCWQVLYERQPPKLSGILEIRHPDEKDYPLVRKTYHLASDEELYADFCGEDFLGGYLDGNFVGYIGVHDEGSMGMLEIFPQYRRRGFARELYSALICRQLALGRIPYGQVIHTNEASLQLQRQMGLTFSKQLIYWMWREG